MKMFTHQCKTLSDWIIISSKKQHRIGSTSFSSYVASNGFWEPENDPDMGP